MLLQGDFALGIHIFAQVLHDLLFQLLEPRLVPLCVVGQRKGKVHPAALELRGNRNVGCQRYVVAKRLVNLGLAKAHKPQPQRAPGQSCAEPPAQIRDQLIANHGLQFTRRAWQRNDLSFVRFENEADSRAFRVLQIGAPCWHLCLPAQVRAKLSR